MQGHGSIIGRSHVGQLWTVPGVLAAGDVRLGSMKRVASAVAEGAMAVECIRQYLKGA